MKFPNRSLEEKLHAAKDTLTQDKGKGKNHFILDDDREEIERLEQALKIPKSQRRHDRCNSTPLTNP